MTPESTLPDFDALWDYDQPAQTETAFRALLPQAQATGTPSSYLELLTQLARSQGLGFPSKMPSVATPPG